MKKIISLVVLSLMSLTLIAQADHVKGHKGPKSNLPIVKKSAPMSKMAPNQGYQRPQIDPAKIKEARETCLKDTKTELPKKGEKPDPKKMEKFRVCMHEKLAPEIAKVRAAKPQPVKK